MKLKELITPNHQNLDKLMNYVSDLHVLLGRAADRLKALNRKLQNNKTTQQADLGSGAEAVAAEMADINKLASEIDDRVSGIEKHIRSLEMKMPLP